MNERVALGLMSGTSCDGVDAAAITVRGRGIDMKITVIGRHSRPYPQTLRRRLLAAMRDLPGGTGELADLNVLVGRFYAETARDSLKTLGIRAVSVIGCHGQTIWHQPGSGSRNTPTRTLQIGEMSFVAHTTGIQTVCDFRQADVAAGGQGAPLVPWTDYVLLRHRRRSRAVQNFGGIGNVTWLPSGGRPEDVVGFDTGPGNMVIDGLVRRITGGCESFDRNGRRAARGRVLEAILKDWMKEPFLRRRPPKSAGWAEFGQEFVERAWKPLNRASTNSDDWLATATAYTARTVADAYRRFLPKSHGRCGIDEIIVCGGGARNPVLVRMLSEALGKGSVVRPIDDFGIEDTAKEAVSFAMLALARLDGVSANLPQVTGAQRPAILGKLIEV